MDGVFVSFLIRTLADSLKWNSSKVGEILMSLPKTVARIKAENISVLYRNYFFMFAMLLFLTALFAVQTVSASGFKGNASLAVQVGYAHMQQGENFSQAQTAFENKNYSYSARILRPIAESGHAGPGRQGTGRDGLFRKGTIRELFRQAMGCPPGVV